MTDADTDAATDATPVPERADLQLIQRCLPHRYPFLLIDRVERIVAHQSAVGVKAVTFNEPQFQGHFPGLPIMPGVMIVEAMGQTAGVLTALSNHAIDTGAVIYFMGFEQAKFRRKVVPGDMLELHVEVKRAGAKVLKYEGTGMVDGQVAATATFSAMIDWSGGKG